MLALVFEGAAPRVAKELLVRDWLLFFKFPMTRAALFYNY
jgi:hypothetical protein